MTKEQPSTRTPIVQLSEQKKAIANLRDIGIELSQLAMYDAETDDELQVTDAVQKNSKVLRYAIIRMAQGIKEAVT